MRLLAASLSALAISTCTPSPSPGPTPPPAPAADAGHMIGDWETAVVSGCLAITSASDPDAQASTIACVSYPEIATLAAQFGPQPKPGAEAQTKCAVIPGTVSLMCATPAEMARAIQSLNAARAAHGEQ